MEKVKFAIDNHFGERVRVTCCARLSLARRRHISVDGLKCHCALDLATNELHSLLTLEHDPRQPSQLTSRDREALS